MVAALLRRVGKIDSLDSRPDALRASSIIDCQHRTTSTAILGFEERGLVAAEGK